jgi:glycosyltransferase involved in cell wall biosynthesis
MPHPEITILTRTRNRPVLLARAMQSVLGQENAPEWEWIVVNDGGDRAEVETCLQAARAGGRLRLLHTGRSQGMEHASNFGLREARGTSLVIHDDDDSWDPRFLSRMAGFLNNPAHREFGGVVCHSVRVVERLQEDSIEERFRHPFNPELSSLDFWSVLKQNPFPPISFLFRRSAYQATGPFNESLPVLGDWEFNLRVLARFRIGVLPEELAFYHHRDSGTEAAYANSITAGDDRHRAVEARLRREWARQNPFGLPPESLGAAAVAAGAIHRMEGGLDRIRQRLEHLQPPPPPQF